MNDTLVTISMFSGSVAAIIGCIRYRQVSSVYRVFLLLMWIALITELIGFFFIRAGESNAVQSNIYRLVEIFLILLFFKRLGLFERWPPLFYVLLAIFAVVWIFNNIVLYDITTQFSSYFAIVASFSYVLMSVTMINRLIVSQVKTLIRHPVFLIMIGFVVFNTFAMLVEIFWVYGLSFSKQFERNVYLILTYINIAVNLIYALAILWMPKKRALILL